MPPPRYIVTVRLEEVSHIPSSMLSSSGQSRRVFAVAKIDRRILGRSRQLSSSDTTLSLPTGNDAWEHVVAIERDEDIDVELELWAEDRGDDDLNPVAEVTASVEAPYTAGTFTAGSTPSLRYRVQTERVPPQRRILAARTPPGAQPAQSQAAGGQGDTVVAVAIENIVGLYEPTGGTAGSVASRGYLSDGNLGRIYLNRDRNGAYLRDHQSIELQAQLHVRRGRLPSGAAIRWTVIDPDDPFDASPEVRARWARFIDDNDYDASATPTGAQGDDNFGAVPSTPWEAVTGFALRSSNATSATTEVANGESHVVLHCPDVAGDNLIVIAELEASGVTAYPARTGVMTMWHLLDLEYVKMSGALDLPVDAVPAAFEDCCVEFRVHPVRTIPNREYMARRNRLTAESSYFITRNFSHGREGGWFCVISAMMPHRVAQAGTGSRPPPFYTGPGTIGTGSNNRQYVEIPGTGHASAHFATLEWTSARGAEEATFGVDRMARVGGNTRYVLFPADVQPEFTAGDGSVSHAYDAQYIYFPQGRAGPFSGRIPASLPALSPPGYGVPTSVQLKLYPRGSSYAGGISPSLAVGRQRYFGGRTMIFTHHFMYLDRTTMGYTANGRRGVLESIVHELGHAFGMPHKCGHHSVYRGTNTCVMNYNFGWMVDENNEAVAGTEGHASLEFCGRHIREIRRTHLEDNTALQRRGW